MVYLNSCALLEHCRSQNSGMYAQMCAIKLTSCSNNLGITEC